MTKRNADERLKQRKRREKRFFIVMGILSIVGLIIFSIYNIMNIEDEEDYIPYETNDFSENNVAIELSEISDGKFHHYDSIVDGVRIKYFAVVDENGEVHTAFDACEICHDSKKGYIQNGDYAQCQNCGKRYSIFDLGTKNVNGGGCWPGYLPHSEKGDSITITKSNLENGKYLF